RRRLVRVEADRVGGRRAVRREQVGFGEVHGGPVVWCRGSVIVYGSGGAARRRSREVSHLARTRTAAPPRGVEPPGSPQVEHPADRAVRLRDRSAIPADWHVAYDAVLTAFQRYEADDDEAARAALQ